MSNFGGNGWESALNDEMFGEMLEQMLEINQEEPNNVLCQPLSQESFLYYPPTQRNANVVPVESSLTQLPTELNRNVAYVESGLTQLPNNSPNSKNQNIDSPVAQCRQRKPRKTWSVQEHKWFLVGLEMCGANWKKISEEIVVTRTPSQLASHAQKYFKRKKMMPSQKKRESIHDITLQDSNFDILTNVHPKFYTPQVQDFSVQNIYLQQQMSHLNPQNDTFHQMSQFIHHDCNS